jgi:hypothetical protein
MKQLRTIASAVRLNANGFSYFPCNHGLISATLYRGAPFNNKGGGVFFFLRHRLIVAGDRPAS